jgi:hypothetical protein
VWTVVPDRERKSIWENGLPVVQASNLEDDEGCNALPMRALTEHLQPEFWKGLGRARHWQDTGAWLFHWHRFIDHIAFGNDIEGFFSRI